MVSYNVIDAGKLSCLHTGGSYPLLGRLDSYSRYQVMPFKDINKKREYELKRWKERYKNDPKFRAAHNKRQRVRQLRISQEIDRLIDIFRKDGCKLCGEKSKACLAAHHVNPSEKEFMLSTAKGKYFSLHRVRTELLKCVCLCANCHAKLHAGEIELAPAAHG